MNRAPVSALELRESFDRAFAAAPTAAVPAVDVLRVRLGDEVCALRLRDVVSVHADRTVVPLLARAPHFLGLAGFRGELAPVYDLRSIVHGVSGGAGLRWLVLVRAPALVGLAFDAFEAHLRVPEADVVTSNQPGHLRGVVRSAGAAIPLIHLASVLEALKPKGT